MRILEPLVGAFNFRDLGGLPTRDGGRTRKARLFRSDTLQALTDDDVRKLVGTAGIETVVDLRIAREAIGEGRGPLAPHVATYLNVPLAEARDPVPSDVPGEMTAEMYLRYLEPGSALPRVVTHVAAAVGRPLVVHCAAGKDRTGVVVATLLDLVGVEPEAIVSDYLATAENLERVVDRLTSLPRYLTHRDSLPPEIYGIEERSIRLFLEGLHDKYGGARRWALDCGIDEMLLNLLTVNLVEPATD